MSNKLSKKDIINLLPHREPMLLIDELVDIEKLKSAKAIVNVDRIVFTYKGIFQTNQLCQVFCSEDI